jgi:acyl carrier protein
MEISTFVENFAEQFEDTPADQIKPDTSFRDLDEWSSLIALSIIAMVDEEYGVTLKGDDIKNAYTVQDIFNRVVALKG